MNVFKPTGSGNFTLKNDEIMISYNPDIQEMLNQSPLAKKINTLDLDGTGGRNEETALYTDHEWYILIGDFRNEYLKVFPDKQKCLDVYLKNIEHRSNWSTD